MDNYREIGFEFELNCKTQHFVWIIFREQMV